MNDTELFDAALSKVGGKITDLATACSVSRGTVHSWKNIAAGVKAGPLPLYARIRLDKVIKTEEPS